MKSSFFDGRTVVKVDTLTGPRVYSTDLTPALFDLQKRNESGGIAARALKIKIITKGLVTLNCQHLVSPLGVHLLDAHPDLFEGSALLPAFREDKQSLADYVNEAAFAQAGIQRAQLDDHLSKLGGLIKQVMPWQLGDVGNAYKRSVTDGLKSGKSWIVYELLKVPGVTAAQLEAIVGEIEKLDFRESRHLREHLETVPENIRGLIKRFAATCYHRIGTDVVRCETGTDLSPLSDFKAADAVLAARDSRAEQLSEEVIFLEAFMGFALDMIQAHVVPGQVIDAINFQTAHQLSSALRKQGFQDKYDDVVRRCLASISPQNVSQALDHFDEGAVADVARGLAKAFIDEVVLELPGYKTAIQAEAVDELYRVGNDVALAATSAATSAIPVVGTLVGFVEVIKTGTEASVAAAKAWSVREQSQAFTEAQKAKTEKIRAAIDRLNAGTAKKTKLLDAVAALSDIQSYVTRRA